MKNEIYIYYNGETENPFDSIKNNSAFMFWEYERIFESAYLKGDFNPDLWVVPYAADIKEWETLLAQRPVDKNELFKLWLYNLLMNHLPEKYQTDPETFLNQYSK